MAWLAIGDSARELGDGDLVVGSGAEAEWRVPTADLMPRHFVVSLTGNDGTVRPASPDHVLVVNGDQVMDIPHVLRDGDVLKAGSGRFTFTLDAPRVTTVSEPVLEYGFLVDDQLKVAHPLSRRSTSIGRDASNAIIVRDPTASRFHAEVRREAGGFALHSMGARGTALNDRPLTTPCLLSEGDTLEIAFTTLRYTTVPPPREISLAPAHSPKNDVAARRPTLEGRMEQLVNEDNPAGRQTRRLQGLAVLVLLLGALWWWFHRN